MTQRVFVAILTVVVFVAGFVARVWTEPQATVPPAPAGLAGEYASVAPRPADKKSQGQLDRAKLVTEIQKLRPQIEAFSGQVDEINAEFDREVLLLLTAEPRLSATPSCSSSRIGAR